MVGSASQAADVRAIASEGVSVTFAERSAGLPFFAKRLMWPPAAGVDVEQFDGVGVSTENAFFSEVLGANQEYILCSTTAIVAKTLSCIGWVYHGQQGKHLLTLVIDSEDFVHVDDAIEIVRAFAEVQR